MSKPYRTQEPPASKAHDAELERLVQAGAHQRREVGSKAEQESYRTLRHAIGRYRGSPTRRAAIVVAALVSVIGWAVYVTLAPNPFSPSDGLILIPMWVMALAAIAVLAIPPYASKESMADEEQWVVSLPFRLDGYFVAISKPPRRSPSIQYELVWADDRYPDQEMLTNLLSTVTGDGKVMRLNDKGADLRDWLYTRKGVTSVSVVTPRVHDMVEKVLVPLHRSYPITSVSVTVPH